MVPAARQLVIVPVSLHCMLANLATRYYIFVETFDEVSIIIRYDNTSVWRQSTVQTRWAIEFLSHLAGVPVCEKIQEGFTEKLLIYHPALGCYFLSVSAYL